MVRLRGQPISCRLAQKLPGRPPGFRMSSCFVIAQSQIAEALRRVHGGTAIEYGLIAALIAAVIAVVLAAIGVRVNQMFASLLSAF